MKDKLFKFINREEAMIEELLRLAERQQKALVTFDTSSLNEITKYQNSINSDLRKMEEQRINFLMNWLKISRQDAMALKLSELDDKFEATMKEEIISIRESLRLKIEKLNSMNRENKVLTNRALRVNGEMLNEITKGNQGVLNAKV